MITRKRKLVEKQLMNLKTAAVLGLALALPYAAKTAAKTGD